MNTGTISAECYHKMHSSCDYEDCACGCHDDDDLDLPPYLEESDDPL